jgi:hypothetical protein
METPSWGLLGPEELASHRRSRTLGLGAVVRSFNNLAVPGLGGVWFGRQLFLATLGVAVAQQVQRQGKRVRNIEVANAIEALACHLAYVENDWKRDPRLRGRIKLQDKGSDLPFAAVRRPGFYVTQPMRRATVQALPALGLVEADGPRFNLFRVGLAQEDLDEENSIGMKFINAVCADCTPHKSTVLAVLAKWVLVGGKTIATPEMCEALSPLRQMSKPARDLLGGRIATDPRRHNARHWVDRIRNQSDLQITLDEKPAELDDEHWRDLCAGTRFFAARAAAIDLLIKIEEHIASTSGKSISVKDATPVKGELAALRKQSRAFLASGYAAQPDAMRFCEESNDPSNEIVLRKMVERDGRVLRLNGDEIELSPGFRGQKPSTDNSERNTEDDDAERESSLQLPFPEYMSPRISNLYYLNLDLRGQLSKELN